MNLQEIHDMAADALAGEELQFKSLDNGAWTTIANTAIRLLHPNFEWRIKPTIEVNGIMMSKRDALKAWQESGATSYEYTDMKTSWHDGAQSTPEFNTSMYYRWQEAKWIYVNGEKIVLSGGNVSCLCINVGSEADKETLTVAIHKLIEIR